MAFIGFLAPPRGRHRRPTPSGAHERLTRLLGVLAVTTAATLGPAGPATASQQVEMARTGTTAEQLWLLGGITLSLTAAGLVALAATRHRRDRRDP
ncbi:hypothetical protein [Streptomyces peucetius]|uniref:Gram-positive cocci surface proteins LPxTG domain-containing protein n=1 Tax=Streptomyces peucetius TaxID=1950 RepID=A0ABY6I7D6_STRPE|nr:hypothetical protein [Streptomyces peucetius]UYQ62913.1 hypothetical protein OGH68_16440 [Streptomyces peucetius]